MLVQHLDPNHESMLAELLSRRTEMRVEQVVDGMPIEPNRVYLIPPNASLVVEEARLRLHDFAEPRGFRRPIDVFFRSLAIDQGMNAACVVLSGTGGDGSEGLRAVKEAGGLTLAQEPSTAKYDGMPRSAVATGLVDKVLVVGEMPGSIRAYFDHAKSGATALVDQDDFLQRMSELMRDRLGHDFSQYKRSTMLRRVQRRMQVVGLSNAEDYLERLGESGGEAELLFRDLLINVTCFFRDAEAFDFLRREVVPSILENKTAVDTVRVWGPGCSSGEEAYSIAILFAEALARRKDRPSVQIFATDIDEPMLQKARDARYPMSSVKDVPIELFDRYFYAHDDDYVLAQPIRDMVRVSNHNLIKDPPFSRCDLVVCRNLLIYLNSSLQQRLVPVFHYSLKHDGWLFLGTAENIAARSDLFSSADPMAKIFRRRGAQRQYVSMPLSGEAGLQPAQRRRSGEAPRDLVDVMTRRIMERYAPAHVVADANNVIVRASSRTGRFLELSEGAPSNKLTDLARPGLRSAVRHVLDTTRATGKRALRRGVKIEDDSGLFTVDVASEQLDDGAILVVFQEGQAVSPAAPDDLEVHFSDYSEEDRVKELEDELMEARSTLRSTVEELETSNEELKSSNEEMMSMNEELQSTNEELATVNEELKNKVEQLARANSDLQNFIESTEIPTIFLDRKLRIRSFTPATRALFRFRDQDKGRPFSDVVSRADQKQIEDLILRALETELPLEEEISPRDSNDSYVLRVLPYRDSNQAVDGIILVFTDVTKIRQTQADLARNLEIGRQRGYEIETLYKTATVAMALVDRNRRYLKVNQQFADLNDASIETHIGRTMQEMMPQFAQRLERPIAEVFETRSEVKNLEVTFHPEHGVVHDFLVDVFPYEQADRVTAVGIVLKDVTEVRRLEKDLRHLMDELQHRVKNTLATVSSIVNQTVATKSDQKDLAKTLKQRIAALAATHHLLTNRDWRNVSLQDILRPEIAPYGQQDRISLLGPVVSLSPRQALTLTLTLHELATNAAKYGALAQAAGRLAVTWTVTETAQSRLLTIDWVETGVQGLDPASVKDSFGTRLIRDAVAYDLGGECAYVLKKEGLSCTLKVPL